MPGDDGGLVGGRRNGERVSYNNGGHDNWAQGGWEEDTRHAPGAAPGWAQDPVWDDRQQWGRPASTSGRKTGLVVAGIAGVVVILGLVATVVFLLANGKQGQETTAGEWTAPAAPADPAEPAAPGATADPAEPAELAESAGLAAQANEAESRGSVDHGVGDGTGTAAGVAELAPAAGTYSGILSQRGTRRSDRDYPVEMTFSAQGSTVEYPTLGCRGTLTPTGNSDGARVYREVITAGRCDATGTWYVTRGTEHAVSAEYQPSGANYVVVGQLTR